MQQAGRDDVVSAPARIRSAASHHAATVARTKAGAVPFVDVASMGHLEKWFRAVEQNRSGLLGMGRTPTYELIGGDRRFTTLDLLAELLGPNHDARRDAHECIDRPTSIFPNGRGELVGIPPVQGGP